MSTNTTSIVLKTDSRGHVHTPRQRREELLAEFERSGLPASRFAALAGVRYQTFATWVQKHRKEKEGLQAAEGDAGASSLRLVEVSLNAEATGSTEAATEPLRVLLPGGAVVEVAGGAQVPLAVQLINSLCGGVPC